MYTGKVYAGKEHGKIRYVGQTCQPVSERIKQHIKKHPHRQRWSWVTLKRLKNTSILSLWEEMDYWERWYIKHFDTLRNGENKGAGGVPAAHRLEHLKKRFPKL